MKRSDWIAAVAAAVTLPLFLWGQMPLAGVDLAHHYALVRVLMDEGIRTGLDPNLGEMNFYPPLSHYLAAAVGFVTGSGFTAILAAAAGAVAGLYVLLLSLLRSVSTTAALTAAVVLGVLVAGRIGLVPGAEIVGNFFFSQLVAYALALTAVAAGAGCYRRHEGVLFDLVVLVAVHVIAFAHLLPALQLLGTYGLVLLAGFVEERTRLATIRLALFSGLGLTLLLHPSFAAMTAIAANEGGAAFGFAMTRPLRILVFVGSLSASGAAMIAFRHQKGAGLFLGAFGCAAALLGLAQWLVFAMTGYGSSYAVTKHLAASATFGLVNASALFGVWLEKLVGGQGSGSQGWQASLVIGIVAVVLPLSTLDPRWKGAADFLAFQSFARLHAPSVPGIALSSKLRQTLNYLISIGDLKLPRDQRAAAILFATPLPPGTYLIFLHDGDEKGIPGCGDTLARGAEFRVVRCVVGG